MWIRKRWLFLFLNFKKLKNCPFVRCYDYVPAFAWPNRTVLARKTRRERLQCYNIAAFWPSVYCSCWAPVYRHNYCSNNGSALCLYLFVLSLSLPLPILRLSLPFPFLSFYFALSFCIRPFFLWKEITINKKKGRFGDWTPDTFVAVECLTHWAPKSSYW